MNNSAAIQTPKTGLIGLRREIDRLLLFSVFFSCLLVLIRVIYCGGPVYTGMIWNMFLGLIPYFISSFITRNKNMIRKSAILFSYFILWLLFIPNSFYMITDLFHLADDHHDFSAPAWFDLVLIISFAWNGLVVGILSIRQMEKTLYERLKWKQEFLFLYLFMCLNALGVYIGRYLRYNSWDIIVNPMGIIRDMGFLILHPWKNLGAWSMIFCFSILMTIMYSTLKKIGRAI